MNISNQTSDQIKPKQSVSRWLSRYGPAIALCLIILLAVGLRLYGLENQSLWNDELSGWRYSQVDELDQVIKRVPRDHPPGFQVFLYYWIHNIGDSAYLLRLPSAIAGIFAVFAIYLLGKKLYAKNVGLIAALMMALFWTPLYYSQEARANSMVLLFTILSTYWLLDIGQALKRKNKLPLTAVVSYIISAALLSYLHYFGLFFVLLQAGLMGVLFIFRRDAWVKLILIYGAILLLYLPWLFRGVRALLTSGPGWLQSPDLSDIYEYFQFLFNNSPRLTVLVFILWAFLFLKGAIIVWRQPSRLKKTLYSADGLLLVWLFVPIVIVFIKSLVSTPAFTHRSLIILLPAAYLLLARALTLLPYGRVTTPVVTILLIGLFTYQLFWAQDYYNKPTKEQFREAVAFVNEKEAAYPHAYTMSFTWDKIYLDYYFERMDSERRIDLDAGQAEDIEEARAALESSEASYFWYIAAHRNPEEAFQTFLETEYKLVHHEPFKGVDVWLFMKE